MAPAAADAPAVRVPGQHLPLADRRGRDALARARRGPARTRSSSTRRAPAPGTWAARPIARAAAAARSPRDRAGRPRASGSPRGLRGLRSAARDGPREPARAAAAGAAASASARRCGCCASSIPASAARRRSSTSPTPTTGPRAASRRCSTSCRPPARGCSRRSAPGPSEARRTVSLPAGARDVAAHRRRRHQRGLPRRARRRARGVREDARRRLRPASTRPRPRAWPGSPSRARCARRACSICDERYLALEWIAPGRLDAAGAEELGRGLAAHARRGRPALRRGGSAAAADAAVAVRLAAAAERADAPTGRRSTPSGACARWRALARERGALSRPAVRRVERVCERMARAVGSAGAARAAARRSVVGQRDGRRATGAPG